MLLGGGEPGEQGDDLEGAGQRVSRVGEGVRGVPDLALAREKHQDVPGSLRRELSIGVDDPLGLVPDHHLALVVLLVGHVDERAVADLHRVRAAGDLDDRSRAPLGIGEVTGESLGVDGRRGDDQLELRTAREQAS